MATLHIVSNQWFENSSKISHSSSFWSHPHNFFCEIHFIRSCKLRSLFLQSELNQNVLKHIVSHNDKNISSSFFSTYVYVDYLEPMRWKQLSSSSLTHIMFDKQICIFCRALLSQKVLLKTRLRRVFNLICVCKHSMCYVYYIYCVPDVKKLDKNLTLVLFLSIWEQFQMCMWKLLAGTVWLRKHCICCWKTFSKSLLKLFW